ncbi:hypothetical protein NEUTE1DRAFT_125110 [Neurospora tetrasperma FGSC 2508]|uniref:Uncharacterized protein n=1 Tax=Neurospora tetrasperma (strain FGSC 2508 / ATCC MYA-4615 / P0657) TaxID=510951 RepID=F8MYI2_NEUT8|nr:uncharacterized protein NEUTE1DRAFT_125110 [Neurospora tetrasperma FGSC 2508]EGO51379.1 hypothetical protein NEUTE1DRAFT_125110 [Neurospora tetrasperma FGSC 2508]
MHLQIFLQVLLLVSSSTALSADASTIPSSYSSSPTSIDKPNLNPRLSWDDIVNGAKSLYSQAMATPTSTTIEVPSSTLSTSPTAATHGYQEESDGYNNNKDIPDKPSENIPSTPGNALRSSPLLVGIWPSRPAFWRRHSASIHQFLEPEGAHLEIPAPETRVPKHDLKSNVKNHAPLPNTVKRSKDTPLPTRRQQKGSAVEAKSSIAPDEEPRAWYSLSSRSADVDNVDSHLTTRASTPDSAKDPDYNKTNGYWVPMEPVYYVLMGMGIVLAIHLVYLLVRCLVGGKDTVKYLKTWQGTVKKHWARKAERRTAKNEVVAPA